MKKFYTARPLSRILHIFACGIHLLLCHYLHRATPLFLLIFWLSFVLCLIAIELNCLASLCIDLNCLALLSVALI